MTWGCQYPEYDLGFSRGGVYCQLPYGLRRSPCPLESHGCLGCVWGGGVQVRFHLEEGSLFIVAAVFSELVSLPVGSRTSVSSIYLFLFIF